MVDEDFTVMIAKDKGLWPRYIEDCNPLFEYLLQKYLHTPDKWTEFCEVVKEMYIMIQNDEKEDCIPSSEYISDLIDEENVNTIYIFFNNENYDLECEILNRYASAISYQLTYKVVEALDSLGLPFRDDLSGEVHKGTRYRYYNPYQIIMFGDEIYEYNDDIGSNTRLHA